MNAMPSEESTPLIAARPMLADQVFDAILMLLLDDKLPTGSQLGIDGLAKKFQVSSTPVREALARLESTGMVRREALRGYRVAPEPTADDIQKLHVARSMLEPGIAALACAHQDDELISKLEACNSELNAARGGQAFADYRAYWKADELFHRTIVEAADNEFLDRAYSSIEGHIQRFRLVVQNVMSGEHTIEEHTKIIEAFRSDDPSAAQEAMQAHISGIAQRAEHSFASQQNPE
ncbi:GntR family transcriptional regulator [Glutamicibacter sp. TV12E]|uniref:GntR family transcriptional regulator n=1 Tax=Glutamicibacter sp. TV12E TaxID=3446362 RepID=UPI0040332C86